MDNILDQENEVYLDEVTAEELMSMKYSIPVADYVKCQKCDNLIYNEPEDIEEIVDVEYDEYEDYEDINETDFVELYCPYCHTTYKWNKYDNELPVDNISTDDLIDCKNIDEIVKDYTKTYEEVADKKEEGTSMTENNKMSLEEATVRAIYDKLDDKKSTEDVEGIIEDILVVTDPDIYKEDYMELIDRAQEVVEDTPESRIPFEEDFLGQYIQICPICGNSFIEDHILEKGTACPICLEVPESFVALGKLESPDDIELEIDIDEDNDELGIGVSEVNTDNLFDKESVESKNTTEVELDREPINASKEIVSNGNILAENKLTESAGTIKEQLNTGVLPIVDVDLYSISSGGVLDNVPDEEWSKLDEFIQDIAPRYIKETVQDVLPSVEIYATGVYHPKFYNYEGDELEFDLVVNEAEYNVLKDKVVNDEGFADYLKDKYSSRSGFVSSMADTIEDFNTEPQWKQMVQVIMYALKDKSFEQINESYLAEFMEAVCQEFPDYGDEEDAENLNEAKFKDKVSAIKKSLKKNDKRLSDETAQKSAEKIAGSMIKKEETTNKDLNQMKTDLRDREVQALKDAGDPNPDYTVGIAKRLPLEVWKELEAESNKINCIDMIHSILTYSPESKWEVNAVMSDKYMERYIQELGKEKVEELVAQEIEEFKTNAIINTDVHTDSEGVTYNAVTFKNESKTDKVKVLVYNEIQEFANREEAIKYFEDAAYNSEGSEQDRYVTILNDLKFTDKDFITDGDVYTDTDSELDAYMDYVENTADNVISFSDWKNKNNK